MSVVAPPGWTCRGPALWKYAVRRVCVVTRRTIIRGFRGPKVALPTLNRKEFTKKIQATFKVFWKYFFSEENTPCSLDLIISMSWFNRIFPWCSKGQVSRHPSMINRTCETPPSLVHVLTGLPLWGLQDHGGFGQKTLGTWFSIALVSS